MDISFISNHNTSRRIFDPDVSILNQSCEVATTYSEYSTLAEYNPNPNIGSICSGFKEITKTCSENADYLTMLDEFSVNLLDYLETIKRNLHLLNRQHDNELSNSAVVIQEEIKTWRLIYSLYDDRFRSKTNEVDASILRTNVYHSEIEVLDKAYKSNKELREVQIVLDWLEYFMKEKVDNNTKFLIGSHGKSWEHTKYLINKMKNRVANELDPDAPLRGKLTLTDNDKTNETEYLKYLFYCVQSGDIEKAKMICQSHEEVWRAQSLDGWKPFHNYQSRDISNESFMSDIAGNPNRNLFKLACRKLSEDTQLNIYERAIYATFCGNLSVLSIVEKDWTGLLWAHFKVHLESMVENYLKTFTNTGFFNTHSIFGEDDLDLRQFQTLGTIATDTGNPIESWNVEQIFDNISTKLVHNPVNISKNRLNLNQKTPMSYYQLVFEMVQQFIILEDINGLIHEIRNVITQFPTKKSVSDKNVIRFLTHVVIFIYSTHNDMDVALYHSVLEEYIKCLLEDKYLDNIAFYISKLSTDLQVTWYCKCLIGVTNYKERLKCVEDGVEYDLPIIEITRQIVQSIRINKDKCEMMPPVSNDMTLDERDKSKMFVSDIDRSQIEALDWLSFLPEQRWYLIRQTNAFCRIFIESDKLQAAKMAMNKISDDIWSLVHINEQNGPTWLASALYENECLRRYIECHDLFGDWFNHFTCQKPADLKLDINPDVNQLSFQEKQQLQKKNDDHVIALQQWEKLLHFHAKKALDCFMGLLKMEGNGWLTDIGEDMFWLDDDTAINEFDNDNSYNRREQIANLRQKCIVTVVFMAVKVLMNSGQNEQCFLLADLLADDQYKLYTVFDKIQLQKLLGKIRQCSLQLMSEGKDSLGI